MLEDTDDIERLLAEEEKRQEDELKKATPFRKAILWLQIYREQALKYAAVSLGAVLLSGIAYYLFLMFTTPALETDFTQQAQEEEALPFEKPNVYALKPFFLPITAKNGTETGQFLKIQVSLLLSNNKLDQELEKALPNLRSGIYRQLSRKTLKDFQNPKKPIKTRLKQEILAMSNSFLVRGSGVITDVLFTEFVVTAS
ncbi:MULTISPECIES: flagellar basal body-associated FliL family protein [unclassified Nitrospina]|uniref:flagellar basal body-associated FliL family protein n=1 Tax=unclassified Nitrospina TaxID=2638683 RepID=UPI003F9834BA